MASTSTSKPAGDNSTENIAPASEPVQASDPKGIRYVGMADVKVLLTEDLEAMGVDSPKGDLEWSANNDRFVPASEYNAATRDVLASDPNFLVE